MCNTQLTRQFFWQQRMSRMRMHWLRSTELYCRSVAWMCYYHWPTVEKLSIPYSLTSDPSPRLVPVPTSLQKSIVDPSTHLTWPHWVHLPMFSYCEPWLYLPAEVRGTCCVLRYYDDLTDIKTNLIFLHTLILHAKISREKKRTNNFCLGRVNIFFIFQYVKLKMSVIISTRIKYNSWILLEV